jgi:hypothetical protein
MSQKLYKNYSVPNSIEKYINEKYPTRMGHNEIVSHYLNRFKRKPIQFIAKLILMTYFKRTHRRKLEAGKIRNGI